MGGMAPDERGDSERVSGAATVPDGPGDAPRDRIHTAETLSAASPSFGEVPALDRGVCVDRYVILDRIGAGGMGVVYAAYDPELDRRVAIKLVRTRAGAEHQRVARDRLLREAQGLAQLSHPNVVSVHDAGTYGDDVFLAMELVSGKSLSDALAGGELSRTELRRILLAAGRGLAAAHRAGLVHRDIKPSNIVIGDDGRVRVLDFGLVRATADDEDARDPPELASSDAHSENRLRTPLTEQGSLVGTPGYMAPESYLSNTADALSDQFAFCVTAFEALCGKRPFTGRNHRALRQAIVDGEPQVPDGVKLPRRIRRVLTRGLAKEPGDRYPSMDALLADLGAESVVTPARVIAVGAAGIALAAATFAVADHSSNAPAPCADASSELAGTWDDRAMGQVRAAFEATGVRYASSSFDRVAEILDAYAAGWVEMRTESCRATRVRGAQSEHLLDLRAACLDRRRQQLGALVQVFAKEADKDVVKKSAAAASSLPPLASCADADALTAAIPPPDDPVVAARVKKLMPDLDRAEALVEAGRYAAAAKLAEQLVSTANDIGYDHTRAEASYLRGIALVRGGDGKGGEAPLRDAVHAAARAHDDRLEARAWSTMVHELGREARFDEAILAGDAARAVIERSGNDPLLRSMLLSNIGAVLNRQEHFEESEKMFRQGIELREKAGATDDPEFASMLSNLANSLSEQHEYDEARRNYDRAIRVWTHTLGPDHPQIGIPLNNLGNSLADQGKYDEAAGYYERAIAQWERSLGPDSALLAYPENGIGGVLESQGRLDDAWPHLERAYELTKKALGPEHPDVGMALGNLGQIRLGQKRYADALHYFEESLRLQEKGMGSDYPGLAYPLTGMGNSLVELGQPTRALPLLERAWRLRKPAHPTPDSAAATELALARALWASHGNRARARSLARDALARLGDTADWQPIRDEIEAWLAHPN